jgi:hypothetical protein
MQDNLSLFNPGPVRLLEAGRFWLGWFPCKPSDNLHVFADGFVVGKLAFDEPNSAEPMYHQDATPDDLHPLLTSITIKVQEEDAINVIPNGVTNVFYCRDAVSDMALLIADAKGLRPDPIGAAVLGTAGFMPGSLTLFSEIRLIPPLHSYDPVRGTLRKMRDFVPQKWDDEAMVERLVSIVPKGIATYLGLSSGYDSRFVLGCLLKAGVRPSLVHLNSEENAVVAQIAYELGLPLTIDDGAPLLPAYVYTLTTDAQIYHRGGNYSRLRRSVVADSVYHTGQFSRSILKVSAGSVVKTPGTRQSLPEQYVLFEMCHGCRETLTGLRRSVELKELKKHLLADVDFYTSYCSLTTRKQLACWLTHVFDSLRWATAHMADMGFYTYPVYLLSDFTALSYGITSPLWEVMGNDRVRSLNHKLLPDLTAPYDDGTRHRPYNALVEPFHKLHYEYGHRAFMVLRDRWQVRRGHGTKIGAKALTVVGDPPPSFLECYAEDLPAILSGGYSRSFKRAAVTVYMCCQYLDVGHAPEVQGDET